MPQIYENLVECSLAAALSSIEIYNKPNFQYREETFTILMINAWELLLKAKILKDANDDITSLYVPDNQGGYKQTRNGTHLTIEINGAINQVGLAQTVANNIKLLVEIRDTVVHFYHASSLNYLLYTLGAATLQNYQKLMTSWFAKSLLEYNFYILPLGFAYNFKTLSLLEFEKEPGAIANLIRSVIDMQSTNEQSDDFYLVCEITAQIKKKVQYIGDVDFSLGIDPSAKDIVIVDRPVLLIDQYPFSYTQLRDKVKKECPNAKQTSIDKVIREHNIKNNPKMSAYNFRTKAQKDAFERTGAVSKDIASIYNENAVRFIVATLPPS